MVQLELVRFEKDMSKYHSKNVNKTSAMRVSILHQVPVLSDIGPDRIIKFW